jgi:hypothetical protein
MFTHKNKENVMKRLTNLGVWLRLFGAVIIGGIVTTGVTYAALQSQQAILSGNTIASATAALQLSKDGGNYSSSATGFDFAGLVPGGAAMPTQTGGYPLWLKNTGSAPLNLNIAVSGTPTTTGDIDLSKVSLILTPVTGGGTAQTIPLSTLISNGTGATTALSVPTLTSGTTMQYKIQVQMAADAFTGSSATISNLNLVFAGTAAI